MGAMGVWNVNAVRHEADTHVMSSQVESLKIFKKIVDRCENLDDLENLIKVISPSSLTVDAPRARCMVPSGRIVAMAGEKLVSDVERELALPLIEAVGKVVLDGRAEDSALDFLRAVPPTSVHAMQRGAYWIGDTYSSDMVVASLDEAGLGLAPGMRMLDYGGSSGSLVRVLAATHPDVHFVACDPVASSIEWAKANLARPNLSFEHQQQRPPLPFAANSFDVVSAISIWSHHGFNAAKLWFDEIYRILKPGGALIFSTHGIGSILYYSMQRLKPLVRFRELYAACLSSGFAFEEVWLDQDDIGNTATALEWGNSYYDPKVIALLLDGHFDIIKLFLRANQSNQDVYVARKKSA